MSVEVTAIMPTIRNGLFRGLALPSIVANGFHKIKVVTDVGNIHALLNKAVSEIETEFFMMCPDDMYLVPGALKLLYESIGDGDVCYGGFVEVNNPKCGTFTCDAWRFNLETLINGNFIHFSSLIRKSSFPGYDTELENLNDWDMYLNMVCSGKKFVPVKSVVNVTFYIGEGITNDEKVAIAFPKIRNKWLQKFSEKGTI